VSTPPHSRSDADLETSVAVFAPALLLSIEIHAGADGRDEIHLHPGGQGYWISKMVQALGATPLTCVAAGGESGHALASLIAADGLDAWLVEMAHGNAVHIDDRRGDQLERIGETRIPSLGRHEIDELYSAIVGASMRAGVCVLAGRSWHRCSITTRSAGSSPTCARTTSPWSPTSAASRSCRR